MNRKTEIIRKLSIYRSIVIFLFIFIVASVLSPSFMSLSNIFNVAKQIAVAGIVACGMTVVILTGGIDLSVGSILGLAGVLSAGVMMKTDNVFLAIVVALVTGLACGILNGALISLLKLPPFIVTLGTMTMLRGIILVYTNGSPIPIRNAAYKVIGKGSIIGIPIPILILIIIYLVLHIGIKHTTFGRKIYALGGNREATWLAGINVKTTEWKAYVVSGLCAAVAGIVLIARLGSAQAVSGEGIEMDAIAAVVLGGTSMSGGSGFIIPTVIGALIMGIIDNILVLLNVNALAIKIVKGIVIICAVILDSRLKKVTEES